ncbi:MAG: hypothetical protein P8173_04160 [Gammaproteobacteria bacterium]|jgi:hypothetical protein
MIVHGVALLVLPPLPVTWWIKLPLAVAVSAHWLVSWRRYARLSSPLAVKRLVWDGRNSWELCGGDHVSRRVDLLPNAYIHPMLVVLRFIAEDKHRYSAVLPWDSLDSDSHRRLRMKLRQLQGEA